MQIVNCLKVSIAVTVVNDHFSRILYRPPGVNEYERQVGIKI